MKEYPAHVRRRSLWVLIVTVAFFAGVSLLHVPLGDSYGRILGFPLKTILTVATYVTAAAVVAALVAWLRTLSRRGKPITVRQLRRQAGYRDVRSRAGGQRNGRGSSPSRQPKRRPEVLSPDR